MSVEIHYEDFAPEARWRFNVSTDAFADVSDFDDLKKEEAAISPIVNPCEEFNTLLDGSGVGVDEDENVGIWSKELSADSGAFKEPIFFELNGGGERFSLKAITFTFDVLNDIYPKELAIELYDGTVGLGIKYFYPNSSIYCCEIFNEAKAFTRAAILVYSMNMPNARLKIYSIDYGKTVVFSGKDLRNVKIIQEVNPISSEISINTADFTIDGGAKGINFQKKQGFKVFFNGEMLSKTFAKSIKRKSETIWDISSEDYIGILESVPFYGGIYNGKMSLELIEEIFNTAHVPYSVDYGVEDIPLHGHIPITNCREALMQIAFAASFEVDTTNSGVVRIFQIKNSDKKKIIPLSRVLGDQTFSDEDKPTTVELVAHSYAEDDEEITAYDAQEIGVGANVFVSFAQPLHHLTIINGQIIQSGSNYAVINAEEGCLLTGKTYKHTETVQTKKREDLLAGELEKTVSIASATLVSRYNVDKLINLCYNYIVNNVDVNFKVVEGWELQKTLFGSAIYGQDLLGFSVKNSEKINVADFVKIQSRYLGNLDAIVTKQTFNLNGGILAKQTTARILEDIDA